MNELPPQQGVDPEILEAQKRVRKIKKFYKELASWAGTSVFLVALDLFLSGGITWSKYPVFFWGIAIAYQFFTVIRLQKLDKEWENRMMRKFTGKENIPTTTSNPPALEDYSEELLRNPEPEKEIADLSEYRKLKKPWEDKDLV